MPPRITEKSCRPRVSDRTMVGNSATRLACEFQKTEWRRHDSDMKPQRGRSIEGPSLRGLWGRSATGQNGQAAANKEVSAVWSEGWMSKNISGVPAGRSVFHLTSPFIGLTENCYSTQFVPASTPLASVASASGVRVPRVVRISASPIAIPRKGQWVIVKRYPLSCLGN
jgi:hypothetical protein